MHGPELVGLGVDVLDDCHRDALSLAVRNVLQTELALVTYAQILDGLPTCPPVWDHFTNKYHYLHPVNDHKNLCPGSLERAEEFRANFEISRLELKRDLVQRYQAMPVSSKGFNLRLIELTACAVHGIAVILMQADKIHDPSTTRGLDIDGVTSWEPERIPTLHRVPYDPWPTLFMNPHFEVHEQYPNGIADIVGYWAENRILGGVTLFDRTQPWGEDDEPNIYYQCSGARVTYRICQLLNEQQTALLEFLKARHPSESPLPVLPDTDNRVRVDPRAATEIAHVYRDVWERRPPTPPWKLRSWYGREIRTSLDFPEMLYDAEMILLHNADTGEINDMN